MNVGTFVVVVVAEKEDEQKVCRRRDKGLADWVCKPGRRGFEGYSGGLGMSGQTAAERIAMYSCSI